MGSVLNPTRKSVAREQGKDWDMVKMTTIQRIIQRAPWTPDAALNIPSDKWWKRTAKARRMVRGITKARERMYADRMLSGDPQPGGAERGGGGEEVVHEGESTG